MFKKLYHIDNCESFEKSMENSQFEGRDRNKFQQQLSEDGSKETHGYVTVPSIDKKKNIGMHLVADISSFTRRIEC